jgi:hypothetical protein
MKTSLVGEDVKSSMTPTERMCSLGRFSDGTNE